MIITRRRKFPQHSLLLMILSNASKKNAPMNGQLVRKIPNASLLLKIVKKNVVKRIAVGNCVWLKRETKLLSMLPSVLQQIIVSG